MKRIISAFIIFISISVHAAPSCEEPLIIKEEVFELRADIEIIGRGSPFKSDFQAHKASKKLVIKSSQAKSIIIKKNAVWELAHCLEHGGVLEFTGNARLICEAGSQLCGNGGTLRFSENARFIVGDK